MSNWENIVGHNWAVEMLASGLANDRLGHAYLITGPEQIGKTTLARTFAQALNCEAPETERPCGRCRPCKLIGLDRHPDVKLIVPEVSGRGKLTLKIETIRQLQQDLNLSAYETRYKVAILERFDAATIGAANAFLKTLEEPPGKVVLLLTATDADMLLPTISSRCRTLNLRPLPPDLIETSLATRWRVPAEKATLLAHLADGRLGWAVQASEDQTILQTRAEQLSHLHEALAGWRSHRFSLADKLSRKPETLPDLLKTWLSWWRDLTLLNQRQGHPVSLLLTNVDEIERLEPLAAAWSEAQINISLNQTNEALWQLERNANTRLVVENLLLIYPLPELA
ncbi:MAG: DNA polymerase III subunit delta' [Anaerolineales bacterium]|nr:DNA polymerase III subunit delta' [Anaerolineales bacterium]MCB8939988.1 DNA polymerase III subunit delta' [Ardenticatenaceae bacterium]